MLQSACCRGGALAGVVWLAFREIRRLPGRLAAILLATAVVAVAKPKLLLIAVPIFIVLAVLRPRFGRRK